MWTARWLKSRCIQTFDGGNGICVIFNFVIRRSHAVIGLLRICHRHQRCHLRSIQRDFSHLAVHIAGDHGQGAGIFVHIAHDANGAGIHVDASTVGIVSDVDEDSGTLTVISGDVDGKVAKVTLNASQVTTLVSVANAQQADYGVATPDYKVEDDADAITTIKGLDAA